MNKPDASFTIEDLDLELARRKTASKHLLPFTTYTFSDYQTGDHHRIICDHLEAVERKEIQRLIIEMPPRHGKSELASVRFPAFFIGRNPDKQIITVSYGKELSEGFSYQVRELVGSENYKHIFPGVQLAPDAAAKNRWRIKGHRGIYVASSVDGGITGKGADLLIIDDPFQDQEQADSLAYRNKVWRWYRWAVFTRLQPKSSIILITTRWHDDDLAGRMIEQAENSANIKQWTRLSLPDLIEPGEEDSDPLGRKPGEPLWPSAFSYKDLLEIREVLGERAYWALYRQQPTREEGEYFKLEWFEEYKELPFRGNLMFYASSDFAVTDERDNKRADWNVHIIWAVDTNGYIYVADYWRGKTGPNEWIDEMFRLQRKWKPRKWACEKGQIVRAVGPFLQRRMREENTFVSLELLAAVRNKEARAQSFRARAEQGMIKVPKGRPWAEGLLDRMVRFPAGKDDHDTDACSLFGRILEKVVVRRSQPEQDKDMGSRTYSFKELLSRSRRRERGGMLRKEAPVLGSHPPIVINERNWNPPMEEHEMEVPEAIEIEFGEPDGDADFYG